MSDEKKPLDKITITFAIALMLGAVVLGFQQADGVPIVEPGTRPKSFTLQRAAGGEVSLDALKGKVVVVNFWATWCPPCRDEIPYLVSTVEEFAPRGVELVAISNDNVDTQREDVERFLTRFPKLTPWVAYGVPGLGSQWGVRALPSMFVLGRDGRVLASHRGQASERQLRGWLEAALAN